MSLLTSMLDAYFWVLVICWAFIVLFNPRDET